MNRSIIAKSVACGLNRVLVTDLHIRDDKFDFHLMARIDKSGYMSGAKFEPTYVEPHVVYDLKIEDRTVEHMCIRTDFTIPRHPSESVDPNYQTPESVQLDVRDVSAYSEVESIRNLMGYVFRSCVASSNFGAAMLTLDCGFVDAQGDANMDVTTNAHAIAEGAQDQHIRLTYEVKKGLVRVRRKVLHIQLDDVTRQTEVLPVVEQLTKEFHASAARSGDWHKPEHFRLEAMANLLCKWRDEEPASYATEPRPDLPDSKEIPLYFRELMDRLPWHGQVKWLVSALAEHNCPVEYLLIGPYEAVVLGNVVVIFSHLVKSSAPHGYAMGYVKADGSAVAFDAPECGSYRTATKPSPVWGQPIAPACNGVTLDVLDNFVKELMVDCAAISNGFFSMLPALHFKSINGGNHGGMIQPASAELIAAFNKMPVDITVEQLAMVINQRGVPAMIDTIDGKPCIRVMDRVYVF